MHNIVLKGLSAFLLFSVWKTKNFYSKLTYLTYFFYEIVAEGINFIYETDTQQWRLELCLQETEIMNNKGI